MGKRIKCFFVVLLFYILRICPIKKNKIVVENYGGRGYGAEGKVICDELMKKNLDLDIVWLCSNIHEKLPAGIRPVKYNTLKSVLEMVTAHIWICNRRQLGFVRKRRKQYYIQTWHGGVCMKMVEKDAHSLPKGYIINAKRDSQMANVFVSGSKWRDENYRKAFWYDGEIIKGDLYGIHEKILKSQEIKERVCSMFGINSGTHILLYAPTFRRDKRFDCYDIDYERLIVSLTKKTGEKWCVIVRLHPGISQFYEHIKYNNVILNGSLLSQADDLIASCDILVTDYSGVAFDGFRMGKHVILYASDLERYLSEERNLYFDLRDLPSPLAKNNDELNEVILNFDEKKYDGKRKIFLDQIGYYNDNAGILVTNLIIKEITKR